MCSGDTFLVNRNIILKFAYVLKMTDIRTDIIFITMLTATARDRTRVSVYCLGNRNSL